MKSGNHQYAEGGGNFASDTPLQFTLRELQRVIVHPHYWLGLAATVIVLTIIGPFDTFTSLPFSRRLVYWMVMATANYFVGFVVSVFVSRLLFKRGAPEWLSRLIGGLVSGLPITATVWAINSYIYQFDMTGEFDIVRMFTYCMVIATIISMAFYLASLNARAEGGGQPDPTKQDIVFLRRLSPAIGTTILSLEAQDHYVNVTTARGSEMILMRLADAIEELSGVDGLRIHRSHWVAREAIAGTVRENGKLMITLSNGKSLPVSRTYSGAVRDAIVD